MIGNKLKEARERAAKSQRQVAQQAGVSQSLVCRYENNMSDPKTSFLLRLCAVLDINLDDLYHTGE